MQVFKGEDYKDVIGAMSDDYGKYFSNTSPFYDEKWSPFNLGIYMDRQDDKPKASKYIGAMPALDRNANQTEMFGEELPVIKIVSSLKLFLLHPIQIWKLHPLCTVHPYV